MAEADVERVVDAEDERVVEAEVPWNSGVAKTPTSMSVPHGVPSMSVNVSPLGVPALKSGFALGPSV